MKREIVIAALALFGTMSFSQASAGTITFDGLAGTNMLGATVVIPGQYTWFSGYVDPVSIGGFNFVNPIEQYTIGSVFSTTSYNGDAGSTPWNGTDFLLEPGGTTTMSQVGGGGFSLNSLDLAFWDDAYVSYGISGNQAIITGNFVGGGSIIQALAMNVDYFHNTNTQIGNDFTRFTLAGFNNLSSVTFTTNGSWPNLAIDNINVTSSVPEPSSILLLGLGLVGLAAWQWKRQGTTHA